MIVFVRHGETAPNRDGLVLGRADPGLTEEGNRQAACLAEHFRGAPIASILTSPLGRARETAAAIGAAAGLEPGVDERLIELDWGAWEGRPAAAIASAEFEALKAEDAAPEGEPLGSVGRRVAAFCQEHLSDPGLVVAVSHVSPIKAAATWALGVDDGVAYRMFLGLASITRVAEGRAGPLLVSFNETAHLSGKGGAVPKGPSPKGPRMPRR